MTYTDIQAASRASSVKGVSPKATRAAQLRRMLSRKGGATIVQIQQAFSWQPQTARAAISSLRKAGAMIERKGTPKGSVYRINPEYTSQ